MNTRKNARLSFPRRPQLVMDVLERDLTLCAAAAAHNVSVPTARKWVGRYLAEGAAGPADRSSRAKASPRANLAPWEAVVRYEHEHPGDLVHIDTKKLGRIERMGRRMTGDRRHPVEGACWEFVFVASDDRARIGFTALYPDQRKPSAMQFLNNTVAYFASLGVRVRRVLADNGSAFRFKAFARACRHLNLKHSFTRPDRPQTDGKAERFIQSAPRERAYGIPYHRSPQHADMLSGRTHHYNRHRPHQGIGVSHPSVAWLSPETTY